MHVAMKVLKGRQGRKTNRAQEVYIIELRQSAAPAHFADRAAIIRSWIRDDPDPRLQLIADPAHCRSGSSSQNEGDLQMSRSVPKIPSKIMLLNVSGSH